MLASFEARSRIVEIALLILPYSETVLWIVVAFVCSAVSGCCSIAISWVMIELTSRPLPMPAELIVAMRDDVGRLRRNLSGAGRRRPGKAQLRSRASTDCGSWLAWATIAVPACCRICARDRLAVSAAKSASMIRPRAADWFSAVIERLEMAKPKRLSAAP